MMPQKTKLTDYKEVQKSEVLAYQLEVSALLVTVTDVEKEALHKHLKPMVEFGKIAYCFEKTQTYYLATFGKYCVVHLQCEMGTSTLGGAISAISQGIDLWDPKFILMVGIAFGIDPAEQDIGDVIVSKSILPYDLKKVGKNKVVQRSPNPPSACTLYNRFRTAKPWKYCVQRKQIKVIRGDVLSGDSLIDNYDYRSSLEQSYPTAVGGEMEGAGLFVAAESRNKPWILVKAVCDYADGKKSVNKLQRQKIASTAAVAYCLHIFDQRTVFEALGCVPFRRNGLTVPELGSSTEDAKVILFDIYKKESEGSYLRRSIDDAVKAKIQLGNVWLTGNSGSGKTSMLLRCFMLGNFHYYFLDLSKCVGESSLSILEYIGEEIAMRTHQTKPVLQVGSSMFKRQLLSWMEQLLIGATQKTFFLLDEFPLDDSEFTTLFHSLFAIISSIASSGKLQNVHIVISSIFDPFSGNQIVKGKAADAFSYLKTPQWSENDLSTLLTLLLKQLRINMKSSDRRLLLQKCEDTPRLMKRVLRRYISLAQEYPENLNTVIADCSLGGF